MSRYRDAGSPAGPRNTSTTAVPTASRPAPSEQAADASPMSPARPISGFSTIPATVPTAQNAARLEGHNDGAVKGEAAQKLNQRKPADIMNTTEFNVKAQCKQTS